MGERFFTGFAPERITSGATYRGLESTKRGSERQSLLNRDEGTTALADRLCVEPRPPRARPVRVVVHTFLTHTIYWLDSALVPSDCWQSAQGDTPLMRHVIPACCFLAVLLTARPSHAQYKGDHIPGFIGLSCGTVAPPGLYVGNVVWIYPTSTVTDNAGHDVSVIGSLTSTLDVVVVSLVTNSKVLGATLGLNAAVPFIKNRIEFNSLDVNSGLAFTDMSVGPVFGWSLPRADITAGYTLYVPTGSFSANASGNAGLGMWGHEVTVGTTVHDKANTWNGAVNFGLEFHSDKSGTDIHVGTLGTIEGGLGKTFYKTVGGPIPMIMNVGLAGYTQFKVTGDSGGDIPVPLRGLKDHVFALGPEFNIFLPQTRLTLLVRYLPEFGARNRTRGQTIVFSIVWVAKSLIKEPSP